MAIRTITARELVEFCEDGDRPYAIVSESTGGYAVIVGEAYLTADGEFVHAEVEMGVLRLGARDEEVTVADTRHDATSLRR